MLAGLISEGKHLWRDIASNLNTPREALEFLAQNGQYGVRKAVAANPNTPKKILLSLLNDISGIRHAVASNPNAPVEALYKLAKDSVAQVRKSALVHPNAPRDIKVNFVPKQNDKIVRH